MASLFTALLSRLGPKELANRLNITERTARSLRFAPLSRFPRVTANARGLTASIKRNTLTRQGASKTEAARHISKSFAAVSSVSTRMINYVNTVTLNSIEFRASRVGMTPLEWANRNPDKFFEITEGVREQMRRSDKRFPDMERDSV